MDGLGIHPLTYVWCLSETTPETTPDSAAQGRGGRRRKEWGLTLGVCECVLAPNLHMVPFFMKKTGGGVAVAASLEKTSDPVEMGWNNMEMPSRFWGSRLGVVGEPKIDNILTSNSREETTNTSSLRVSSVSSWENMIISVLLLHVWHLQENKALKVFSWPREPWPWRTDLKGKHAKAVKRAQGPLVVLGCGDVERGTLFGLNAAFLMLMFPLT